MKNQILIYLQDYRTMLKLGIRYIHTTDDQKALREKIVHLEFIIKNYTEELVWETLHASENPSP